jgi:hypothetical protein
MKHARWSYSFCCAAILSAGTFTFSGCVNMPTRMDTPSGNPEVMIDGVNRKAVADALANGMINAGWQIKSSDEYQLVFKRQLDSLGGMMLYGSNFNAMPEARVNFTLLETSGSVRVIGSEAAVTNPNSGFEQVTEMHGAKDMNELQASLNGLKRKLGISMPGFK